MIRLMSLVLLCLMLTANLSAQQIKFATVAPEGSTYLTVFQELDAEIRKLTGGKVKFKIYPSQIQGDEKDVLRKIRLRQLHSAGFTGVGLGEILPELRILELPLLFRSYDEVDYITNMLYEEFSQKFEKKGFVILGWADVGFANIYAQKPVISLDDLRKTKLWMWEGDPLAEATFRALKVGAISLPLPDVLTSLQTNLVEAVYVPPMLCVSLQWHTRIKTMMDIPLANVTGAVLISKRRFEKLSPDHRKILKEKSREYMKKLVRLSREDHEKATGVMKQNGIQYVKVPLKNQEAFYSAVQEAHQSLVGKLYPQELLDRVVNALEKYRSEIKEKSETQQSSL